MKPYEYLPHTADVRFRAYGRTLEEAFSNSALAMENIMLDTKKVVPNIERKIQVRAKEPERLLFEFLGRLLFLLDAENFVLNKIGTIKISRKGAQYILDAVAVGDEISEKYETMTQVKAITYNEMSVKEEKGIWVVSAVTDV